MPTTLADFEAMVGTEIGVSDWLLIDQKRIAQFADATNDHQWIHVDEERARRELPTGKTIAHGYLTLSLIPCLTRGMLKIEGATRVINYGLNKVRFMTMVPVNSRVRARQKLVSVRERAGAIQTTNEITIEIEGEKRPACVAETIGLFFTGEEGAA
ncbi:MAG: MaoC family dehydratase [Alphaproteobacteria bacterium]